MIRTAGFVSPSQSSNRRPKTAEALLVAVLVVLIGWFYWWTAFPIDRGEVISSTQPGYYNLQANGFLKGELSLDKPADPFLATLQNPWDPAQRGGHGLHDATYFKGKYYMYFGVTPVLTLFLPLKLLTGVSVSESAASVIFAWGGLVALTVLLWEIRWRYFPNISIFWMVGGTLAVGLAAMIPALLRRPSIWEVPITGAYFYTMMALYGLHRSLRQAQSSGWLVFASLWLGFAIGARPVYLFGCAGLLIVLEYQRRGYGRVLYAWRNTPWRRNVVGSIVPLLAVGVGLAMYNYLRFGSIAEFGQRYQMAGDDVTKLRLFSWAYPLYGLRLYLLEPATWTPYFPFVTVITPPPPPPGQLGVEDPYGIFPNIPFVFVALGVGALWWPERRRMATRPLGAFMLCAAVIGVFTMATVMSFGGITNRYMVDFVPALILIASVGMFTLAATFSGGGWAKRLALSVVALLLLFSVAFNVFASLKHNDLLRDENPKLYAKLAYQANRFSQLIDTIAGYKYGPIEMSVVFPRGTPGRLEAICVTGTSFRADYIYIEYLDENTARFGLIHTSYPAAIGNWVHFKPGQPQKLQIDMGSLYPPAAHPYYDTLPRPQARIVQRLVKVTLDGQVALKTTATCFDATSHYPSLGTAGDRPAFKNDFSGKILSWRRAPELMPVPPKIEYGPVRIELKFPAFAGVASEPLVCSGEQGKGDLVYVHYDNDHTVSFGHDNWGGGGRTSDPVTVDYNEPHIVEIDYGALYPAADDAAWPHPGTRDRVIVRMDGKVVMDVPAPFHPSAPDDILVGINAIQASSAGPGFTGSVNSVSRLAP